MFDVLYARVYHRVDVLAPCRLPRTGAGILVCNHISGLDPILIQAVCPRLIVWMMAEEYARSSLLRPIFKNLNTILVSRKGQDLTATRQALRALRAGMILGVFPEGKIEPDRNLLPFQPGVAMIAQHTGVPIYPAYIDGTSRGVEMPAVYLFRQAVRLRFGLPFRLPKGLKTPEATDLVRSQVNNLAIDLLKRGNFSVASGHCKWIK